MRFNWFLIVIICSMSRMAAAQTLVQEIMSPSFIETQIVKSAGIKTRDELLSLSSDKKIISRKFYDGYGREIQEIFRDAGKGTNSDLINVKKYNSMGTISIDYLPYAKSTSLQYQANSIADQQSFYSASTSGKYAKDNAPYAEIVYENSPMQRVLQEGSYGANWQLSTGKVKSYLSRTNTTTDQVRLLKADGSSSDFYGEGLLNVYEATDEAGFKMILFKDKADHVILKRQLLDETIQGTYQQYKDTYYIYSYSGLVTMVLPPKVTASLKAAGWVLATNDVNNNVFRYLYDEKGLLIQRKAPSSAWIYIIYDKLDRPVLLQNAKLRSENKWIFTKYDRLNRPIMEGVIQDNTNTTYTTMQSVVLSFDYTNPSVTYFEKIGGALENYSNLTFPTNITSNNIRNIYYYDSYDIDGNGTDNYLYVSQNLGTEEPVQGSGQGNLTMLKTKVIGTNNWIQKIMFYSSRGEMVQLRNNNVISASLNDIRTVVHNFDGTVKKKISIKNTGTEQKTTETFSYDIMSRLKDVTHQVNNQPAVLTAQYDYNELGQLTDKNLGMIGTSQSIQSDLTLTAVDNVALGQTKSVVASKSITLSDGFASVLGSNFSASIGGFLQSVDYQYNIRGWLTKINNPTLTADGYNEESNDVFGMELLYEQQGDIGNSAKFNGLISGVKWRSKMTLSPYDNLERSYIYNYDKIGQLRDAIFKAKQGSSWSHMVDAFSEKEIQYDLNGNITALRRFMWNSSTNATQEIDQLSYTFSSQKQDQLVKVEDPLGAVGGIGFKNGVDESVEYEYDDDGRLIRDKNKGFLYSYNEMGKVATMTYIADASKYISFDYTSSGEKLRKSIYQNGNLMKQFSYLDEFVYEDNAINYVSHSEGRVRLANNTLKYEYFIKDHLGNVRVSFEEQNGMAVVRQESSYYAFGMQHAPIGKPTDANKDLFNSGSEWISDFDNDPDLYSTFFRNYDPVLGRFYAVDPMADKYADYTVYNFAFNNPISLTDPSGADPKPDLEQIFIELLNSEHGGKWSAETGVYRFGSDAEAFAAGVAYNDEFKSWDFTGKGHRERSIENYVKNYGGDPKMDGIRLNEVKIFGRNQNLKEVSKDLRKTSGYLLTASKLFEKSFKQASLYSPPNSGKTALVIFEKSILGKRIIHQPLFEINALKAGKYASRLKTAGRIVGAVGVVAASYDMVENGITTSNGLDPLMSGMAVTGIGSGIAGTYFLLNSASIIFTGEDIGQHIDSGVKYLKEQYSH